jgi:hypothetical protein
MTDRAVLKWTVSVDDRPHKIGGGDIVHVAVQYPGIMDTVTVWTIEPRNWAAPPKRTVQVFGTGQPLPFFATHIGSTLTANGGLVWHVFELPEVDMVVPETAEAIAEVSR